MARKLLKGEGLWLESRTHHKWVGTEKNETDDFRSSGITDRNTSAEIVDLATQHTWNISEMKDKIPTASPSKPPEVS